MKSSSEICTFFIPIHYSFPNSFKTATLQSLYNLKPCKIYLRNFYIACNVAFLPYLCFTASSSQYHELLIFFARMPNSFFAFSNVLFEMPCSSAISKTSLLCTILVVSANSRSICFACSSLFAFGAIPPSTSSAVIS